MDLTRKINGIINPTIRFQESKPQNGDPDEFSSQPRRKTKISLSTKNFNAYGFQNPEGQQVDKDMLWIILEAKEGIFIAK